MSTETYRAVYDAAMSALGGGYLQDSVRGALWAVETAAYEQKRPCVLHRPTLSADGNMWCALLGDDLQIGVAGFGETPAKAMEAFDLWPSSMSGRRLPFASDRQHD